MPVSSTCWSVRLFCRSPLETMSCTWHTLPSDHLYIPQVQFPSRRRVSLCLQSLDIKLTPFCFQQLATGAITSGPGWQFCRCKETQDNASSSGSISFLSPQLPNPSGAVKKMCAHDSEGTMNRQGKENTLTLFMGFGDLCLERKPDKENRIYKE